MDGASRPVVGILAGGGTLPREIADAAAAGGARVVIVGLEGEAAQESFPGHDVTIVNWGRIGELIRTLKSKGVTDLVIVGSVRRPDLGLIRTDLGFWWNLVRILRIVAAGGDDHVLRRVVRFFEGHGFVVRGPADVAPALVIRLGALGRQRCPDAVAMDVTLGREIITRLAPFDVGQAVVVADGAVLTIEGAEGTDRMMARVGQAPRGNRSGILVKFPKPGQELRVDMPAVGPATIDGVVAAGLLGIAVAADATLAAERARLIETADRARVFVEGVAFGEKHAVKAPAALSDGTMGLQVLRALSPLAESRGAVVVRRHVLAIETGEGIGALIRRAADLRQWGAAKGRRRGALAVRSVNDLSQEIITAAAGAGYEVIAVEQGSTGTWVDAIHRAGLKLERGAEAV